MAINANNWQYFGQCIFKLILFKKINYIFLLNLKCLIPDWRRFVDSIKVLKIFSETTSTYFHAEPVLFFSEDSEPDTASYGKL